jgi:SAM-dependent methyltransferase
MIKRIARSLSFRARAATRVTGRLFREIKKSFEPMPESKHLRMHRELEHLAGGLSGKRILEIGSDSDGEFLSFAMKHGGCSDAVGINIDIQESTRGRDVHLVCADARSIPFDDDTFDAIYSMSVFEHVQQLDRALSECYRVLRPGGVLLSEFGPIWSGSQGHHLWFYYGGAIIDWNSHRLPPFAHLLMTRPQLLDWCRSHFRDEELCERIVAFVFESPEQNRVFYSDYVAMLRASPFQILVSEGYSELLSSPDEVHDYAERLHRVTRAHPDKYGFGISVMKAALYKPLDPVGEDGSPAQRPLL